MQEKKGPHITVTPMPASSSGTSTSASSVTSCLSGIGGMPERARSGLICE